MGKLRREGTARRAARTNLAPHAKRGKRRVPLNHGALCHLCCNLHHLLAIDLSLQVGSVEATTISFAFSGKADSNKHEGSICQSAPMKHWWSPKNCPIKASNFALVSLMPSPSFKHFRRAPLQSHAREPSMKTTGAQSHLLLLGPRQGYAPKASPPQPPSYMLSR